MKCESLSDLMERAFNLSLDLTYKDMSPDGHYLTPRELPTSSENESTVSCWADGLVHKYYQDRASGHCSLQASIDFDLAKFEASVVRDIDMMTKLLAEVGKPVKLDFAEMQRRGYRGAWAGLPS
jgi:hypothetical protein